MKSRQFSSIFTTIFIMLSVLVSSGCVEVEETEEVLVDDVEDFTSNDTDVTDTSNENNLDDENEDPIIRDLLSFSTIPEVHEWIEDNEIEPDDENTVEVDGFLLNLGIEEALFALQTIGTLSSTETIEYLTGEEKALSAGFLIDSNIVNYFNDEDGLIPVLINCPLY